MIDSPPESAFLSVRRVFGDGPFAEIGEARGVAEDPAGIHIAVAGSLGRPQWVGHDVGSTSGSSAWHRVGIYHADTLRCRHLVPLHWPVNTMAFHPSLPLVGIGSGSYDGGYMFEGELTIVNLDSGRTVSVLDECRQISHLRWRDAQTLELTMAVRDDEEADELGTPALTAAITSGEWTTLAARSVRVADLAVTPIKTADEQAGDADIPSAEAILSATASAKGLRRKPRRQVWTVAALRDGRILAGLEHVAAECWTATGEPLWTLPTSGTGCQLFVDPAERTAYINNWTGWWPNPRVAVERIELLDGRSSLVRDLDYPAVLVADRQGWLAVRDCTHHGRPRPALMMSPDGAVAEVELGGYDLFNHFFDIRQAPALLFLQGAGQETYLDKWVVALDMTRREVTPLFPLEWEPARARHIFGGPGVFVTDSRGDGIIHGCAIHDGRGLLPGNAGVVRRAFPGGETLWVHADDHQVTALEAVDDVVYAAFNSGEVIALSAGDGQLLGRQRLAINGLPVVPLSLSAPAADTLVIGTMDGRILTCHVITPS